MRSYEAILKPTYGVFLCTQGETEFRSMASGQEGPKHKVTGRGVMGCGGSIRQSGLAGVRADGRLRG